MLDKTGIIIDASLVRQVLFGQVLDELRVIQNRYTVSPREKRNLRYVSPMRRRMQKQKDKQLEKRIRGAAKAVSLKGYMRTIPALSEELDISHQTIRSFFRVKPKLKSALRILRHPDHAPAFIPAK